MTNGRDAASRGLGKESKRPTNQSSSDVRRDMASQASDAASKVADAAQQAGGQAKEAAASLASEASQSAKSLINQQIGAGADVASHIAQSVRLAADHLGQKTPLLADMARGAADKVDEFSQSIRGQTVDEVFGTAADFVRRKPALVFSAAAACGFVLFRLLKAGTEERTAYGSPHRQFGNDGWPLQPRGDEWRRNQGAVAGGMSPGNRARPGSTSVGRQGQTGQFHDT